MLAIDNWTLQEIKELQRACTYLFAPEQLLDRRFLKSLNLFLVKQAYLRQARGCHPAATNGESEERRAKKGNHLRQAHRAFELLSAVLEQGGPPPLPAPNRPCIIAVGGSKGGIGKSMFSANLAVLLSQQGHRTVAIDLDLGGANLTLSLGDKFILDRTVNDFLNKKYDSLQEIAIASPHGPLMIGGDSSELGAANIHHLKKMKLMKAIRELAADYVVLDLGGDTSFNMLDFFLLADHGLVLTTPDAAAYIGAYQFLKTALFRKLQRLSGPEADGERIEDRQLAELLKQCTTAGGEPPVASINELLQRVAERDEFDLPMVLQAIIAFSPSLVVNRVRSAAQFAQVGQTIISLAEKNLSIHLQPAGSIKKYPEIEDVSRSLAPPVARAPGGEMAREITAIAAAIGLAAPPRPRLD